MPYIGKLPSKDEVAKKLLSMLREGKENEVDPAVMEEVDKIPKVHEDSKYIAAMHCKVHGCFASVIPTATIKASRSRDFLLDGLII